MRRRASTRTSPLRDAVERLAWEVLTRGAVTRPPVDIDAVAAAAGLRFFPVGFDQLLGGYVHDFPTPRGYNFPGARRPRTHGPLAMIGSHQHPLRQRFTKAHELAHHLMDEPQGWVARMRLSLPSGRLKLDYHEPHEFFAASLLMPRQWVERFDGGSWRRDDVARLARRFGVTKIAAATRLEELYGRPRQDIVPASVPAGELIGLYAQA